jgi:phosphopantothenoylcysteine decarboxylase/phosphopantothenate--cysteine ligase
MSTLNGKKIVLGVTGSIAAYKSVELLRLLTKAGAIVNVAMTANAAKFVGVLTFESLSGNRVIADMFSHPGTSIDHVSMGRESDLMVIAPATANFLAKAAYGLGDDFISTLILAATSKILVCPAMDKEMFLSSIVQENILKLKTRGFAIMEPEEGKLATGAVGVGRLPDPPIIMEEIKHLLADNDLQGLKILITAGPTIEYIDPVRVLTNRSTGKMGYALARAAWRRGADVTLVTGPTYLEAPIGVHTIRVKTAEEMRRAVLETYKGMDVVIKAAAVSDYKPKKMGKEKEKKTGRSISLEMAPTPDILAELGKNKKDAILVGFAAETDNHIANALKKIEKKNLDLIVVNDVSMEDRGFASDLNEVWMVDKGGSEEKVSLMPKEDVADKILDKIKGVRK